MKQFLEDFLKSFTWYRQLTIQLAKQIPSSSLQKRICKRSLTAAVQLIDLGDFQIKILELLSGKNYSPHSYRPNPRTATKGQIVNYLLRCDSLFQKEIKKIPRLEKVKVSWFGRMEFNAKETLTFFQAHEAMHHGELLSLIYSNNLPMPQVLKETWGFDES